MHREKNAFRFGLKGEGVRQSDLLLKGGTVLNVYSGELLKMNVAIKGERILYVGQLWEEGGEGTAVLNVDKKILVPGYVEPHCHPWVFYNPLSFAKEAGRLGTTTFFCDSLLFYLLMGPDKFESFISVLSDMPVKFFWTCRTAPQSPMENEDELFSVDKIERLLRNQNVASLGEITRWQDLLNGDPKLMALVGIAKRLKKRVDGHTAGANYEKLNGLSWSGVESCHESIHGEQALERLRLGLYVMLRQSSLRRDLKALLKTIISQNVLLDRMMLTTDGSSPSFYQEFGINDNLIKIAMQAGLDPVSAYRMATINPAVYFGVEGDIGGIAPGRYADILVLEDLRMPTPETVISKGRIIAKRGALTLPFPEVNWKKFFPGSCFSKRPWKAKDEDFRIPSCESHIRFPTIDLVSAVITRTEWLEFTVRDGFLDLDGRKGLSHIAVINKDGKWVTNGLIRNFAEGVEGFASSYNTAAEILVMGNSPSAMSAAVNRVIELGGGIAAFEAGRIAYELKLPLGGIMSESPMSELAEKEEELKAYLSGKGHPYHDPIYTLVFLPNDFLPEVRINYNGIVDIKRKETLWKRRDLTGH